MTRTTPDPLAQRKEELKEMFHNRVAIAKSLGMRLDFTEDNRSLISLPYNDGFDNGFDVIHGGIYMTLIDTAGWFATAVHHQPGYTIATSEFSVHFLGSASKTDLVATGRVLKAGKRQDVVEVYLNDKKGKHVGHGIGTFVILRS